MATPDFIMDPPLDWYEVDFKPYLQPAGFEWTDEEYDQLMDSIDFYDLQAERHGWFAFVK